MLGISKYSLFVGWVTSESVSNTTWSKQQATINIRVKQQFTDTFETLKKCPSAESELDFLWTFLAVQPLIFRNCGEFRQ